MLRDINRKLGLKNNSGGINLNLTLIEVWRKESRNIFKYTSKLKSI